MCASAGHVVLETLTFAVILLVVRAISLKSLKCDNVYFNSIFKKKILITLLSNKNIYYSLRQL